MGFWILVIQVWWGTLKVKQCLYVESAQVVLLALSWLRAVQLVVFCAPFPEGLNGQGATLDVALSAYFLSIASRPVTAAVISLSQYRLCN